MLRRQLRTLREFVEAYDFTIMQPASEGRWMSGVKQALAYVEQPQNGLRIGLPSGRYRVTWLDPVSGELAGEEAIRSEGDLEVKAPAGLAEAVVGIRPA